MADPNATSDFPYGQYQKSNLSPKSYAMPATSYLPQTTGLTHR
jgi:hypothetical protein